MATLEFLTGANEDIRTVAVVSNEPCILIEGDNIEINYVDYTVSHFNTIIVGDKITYQIHVVPVD